VFDDDGILDWYMIVMMGLMGMALICFWNGLVWFSNEFGCFMLSHAH